MINQVSINEMKTRGEEPNCVINKEDIIKIYPHFEFRCAEIIIIKSAFTFKLISIDFKKRPRTIEDMLDPDNWERRTEETLPIGNLELELQARAL